MGDFPSIPTISSGFAQLETKFSAILDKIQALPIDDTMKKIGTAADEAAVTVAESRKALKEIQETTAPCARRWIPRSSRSCRAICETPSPRWKNPSPASGPEGAIQGDLLRTLDELRSALRSMNAMATSIDEKPNSLIFGRDSSGNPIPKAPKANR